ncbi:MAG: helix-turn-helix transcriptional regulator [Leptolyngbya sp. SIO1D8]|nr:helix-turn-helix transcriptional regulator [Leptolyngbya sp. SIO1D8]
MKPGSKYYPLYQHLTQCKKDPIALTLTAIEALIAGQLPISARTKRGWWSNRSTGALQASAWIAAGYHTHTIDLNAQIITFKKFKAEYKVQYSDGEITWNRFAIKALRKHMQLTQVQFAETLGVRRQTVSEWENGVYLPERSTLKHLGLVAEKENFQGTVTPEQNISNQGDG